MLIPLKDRNPTRIFPYVTIALITFNIFIFLLQSPFGNERVMVNVLYRFGFIPRLFVNQFDKADYAESWEMLRQEFLRRPLQSRGFYRRLQELNQRAVLSEDLENIQRSRLRIEPLTLVTSLFLHGSLFHVLANMLFLWVFGNNIEDAAGHAKFLLFYLLCGVLASLAHMAVNTSSFIPTVGASGAISGVMGAYLVLYPYVRVLTIIPFFYFLWYPIELPAFLYLGYWILIQVVLGHFSLFTPGQGGVAWFAHIGGFFAGVLLIFLFKKRYVRSALPFLED
jgi:membrane associated rhomboid family serine protease